MKAGLLMLLALCLSGCLGTLPTAPETDSNRIRGTWVEGVEAYQVNRFLVVEQEQAPDQICTWVADFYVCY